MTVPVLSISDAQSCSTEQLFTLWNHRIGGPLISGRQVTEVGLKGPYALAEAMAGSWQWSQENMTERATLQVMVMLTLMFCS